MTFEQATALGRKDGEADVREVLAEQGLDVIKATLAPGHVSWDEGAINAGAAALAGVPEKFHRAYYEAYRDAARALAVELTEREGAVKAPAREYLGDGVYASFDGYYIWLTTDREGVEHQIALDPSTFAALVAYKRKQAGGASDD